MWRTSGSSMIRNSITGFSWIIQAGAKKEVSQIVKAKCSMFSLELPQDKKRECVGFLAGVDSD
jgi:hypothetical protein